MFAQSTGFVVALKARSATQAGHAALPFLRRGRRMVQ
jgi:hypothetical protein